MKRQLSDEQLDNLMRTLMSDAVVDETMVNDIADSPTLWWGVQRQINQQKAIFKSPWPSALILRRWLIIGLPAAAAAALFIVFFVMRDGTVPADRAINVFPSANPTIQNVSQPEAPFIASKPEQKATAIPVSLENTAIAKTRLVAIQRVSPARHVTAVRVKKGAEIKTEFIALSYARSPESGQIVRVKVPGSMMVTLGLVASVEKPSNLVDAEVLIGDDGTTHSIRFIR